MANNKQNPNTNQYGNQNQQDISGGTNAGSAVGTGQSGVNRQSDRMGNQEQQGNFGQDRPNTKR